MFLLFFTALLLFGDFGATVLSCFFGYGLVFAAGCGHTPEVNMPLSGTRLLASQPSPMCTGSVSPLWCGLPLPHYLYPLVLFGSKEERGGLIKIDVLLV